MDGQNTPHRDVFYPSYKCFIYLNDVDEENGAFVYYPKSHQFSPKFIWKQYKNSLSHYFKRNSISPLKEDSTYSRLDCSAKAGAAIFFNVAGLHHRGRFTKDKDRERIVLLIDFRQQEAAKPRKTTFSI